MHDVLTKDKPTKDREFGNPAVIELLTRWLEAARTGSINYIAIVGCVPPQHVLTEFAGSIQMEQCVPTAIDTLRAQVVESVAKRKPPVQPDPALTADYFCFNVAVGSLGFDFVQTLISAEMERVRAGAPAPLKVHFWKGAGGELGLETEYRRQTFEHIVRPSLKLIGAVEDERALFGRQTEYFYWDVFDRARQGEPIPTLRPSIEDVKQVRSRFLDRENLVTITLRESETYPHRNSNLRAWTEFAHELEKTGHTVIIVRDTAKAYLPLKGLTTYPEASVVLGIRMALYARAECNFFVSNGPGSLGWYGTRPFLQFIKVNDSSRQFFETSEWWKEAAHMEVGGQLPWCRPDQRIVWEADSFDNIRKAWDELCLQSPGI
jgi:hypothetical protein